MNCRLKIVNISLALYSPEKNEMHVILNRAKRSEESTKNEFFNEKLTEHRFSLDP